MCSLSHSGNIKIKIKQEKRKIRYSPLAFSSALSLWIYRLLRCNPRGARTHATPSKTFHEPFTTEPCVQGLVLKKLLL